MKKEDQLRPRQVYDEQFKAKVALEAIKGEKTIAQISTQFKVHPIQILKWKKHLLEHVAEVFSKRKDPKIAEQEEMIDNLFKKIGQQDIELEFLKKSTNKYSCYEKRDDRICKQEIERHEAVWDAEFGESELLLSVPNPVS